MRPSLLQILEELRFSILLLLCMYLCAIVLFCALRVVNLNLLVWRTVGKLPASVAFEAFLVVQRLVLGQHCFRVPCLLHMSLFSVDLFVNRCLLGLDEQLFSTEMRHPLHLLARQAINFFVIYGIYDLIDPRVPWVVNTLTRKMIRGNTQLYNDTLNNYERKWVTLLMTPELLKYTLTNN